MGLPNIDMFQIRNISSHCTWGMMIITPDTHWSPKLIARLLQEFGLMYAVSNSQFVDSAGTDGHRSKQSICVKRTLRLVCALHSGLIDKLYTLLIPSKVNDNNIHLFKYVKHTHTVYSLSENIAKQIDETNHPFPASYDP